MAVIGSVQAQQPQEPPPPDNPIDSAIWYSLQYNYQKGFDLIARELAKEPDNALLNNLMGQAMQSFCHEYLPYTGYTEATSDSILNFLQKGLAGDPAQKDIYFLIGKEYGFRMMRAYEAGDMEKARSMLQAGYEAGGYPDWLLEYAQNTLRTCDSGGVLFVGEQPEFLPLFYLQFVKGYRTDVMVLPMPLLNLDWFVARLLDGTNISGFAAPVRLDKKELSRRNFYPFGPDTLEIEVPSSVWKKYTGEDKKGVMYWGIEPDLSTYTMRFISRQKSFLLDLIKTNNWKRPLYFSNGCPRLYIQGLEPYMQRQGLAAQLMPIQVNNNPMGLNVAKIQEILLDSKSYESFKDFAVHPIPMLSNLLNNYRASLYGLALLDMSRKEYQGAKDVVDKAAEYMPQDIFPLNDQFTAAVTEMRKRFKEVGLE